MSAAWFFFSPFQMVRYPFTVGLAVAFHVISELCLNMQLWIHSTLSGVCYVIFFSLLPVAKIQQAYFYPLSTYRLGRQTVNQALGCIHWCCSEGPVYLNYQGQTKPAAQICLWRWIIQHMRLLRWGCIWPTGLITAAARAQAAMSFISAVWAQLWNPRT